MLNVEFNTIIIPKQPPEYYYGNKEYKISLDLNKIKHISKQKNKILDKKASQMLFRLIEGNGKAIYLIGVSDNGEAPGIQTDELLVSLFYMCQIVKLIDAHIKIIRIYNGSHGYIATIRITKKIIFNLL
jgi:elongation factor 1-alpha